MAYAVSPVKRKAERRQQTFLLGRCLLHKAENVPKAVMGFPHRFNNLEGAPFFFRVGGLIFMQPMPWQWASMSI